MIFTKNQGLRSITFYITDPDLIDTELYIRMKGQMTKGEVFNNAYNYMEFSIFFHLKDMNTCKTMRNYVKKMISLIICHFLYNIPGFMDYHKHIR